MANVIFNSLKADLLTGAINLESDTIKVMLVTSAYVPDADNHARRDDVTNEASGTGYSAGGATLANQSVAVDPVDNEAVFDADDVVWPASTITARGAVLYKSRGGAAADDELLAYVDFGSDKSSSGAAFTVTWDATGILALG
jgi:hypothetical protein